MTISKFATTTCLALGLSATTGCASFALKDPPTGFIEVSSSHYSGEGELRMKAPDNVGLNITTFSNHRGGNLSLWSEDMIQKLGQRGYVLERQTAVKSGNKVEGTRFDFTYVPAGSDESEEKFYTAVLFVTDAWRVVVQLAGQSELGGAHGEDLDRILGRIKIRGCKLGSKVCNSGQPRTFDATHEARPNGPGEVEATDDDAGGSGEAGDQGDASGGGEADEPAAGEADKPSDG